MEEIRTDTPNRFGSTTTTGTDTGTCDRCGQALGRSHNIEQFLGKLGITDEMLQNIDIDEYVNMAREYLKNAGEKVRPVTEKAKSYTRENPGKVAAGVAILAVGAGLLISSMREK